MKYLIVYIHYTEVLIEYRKLPLISHGPIHLRKGFEEDLLTERRISEGGL